MTRLSYLSVIHFSGADARRFLHGQLTEDIEGLADGAATFACLCQPKGRVIALLLVCPAADGFDVLCAQSLAAGVAARLSMFVMRDDVQITVRDDVYVHGQGNDQQGKQAATVFSPLPGLAYTLLTQSVEADTQAEQDWKAQELASGVTWLDEASSEKFLPQMLGMEAIGALNFRKGCFPGQEIIARTRYLGKLKQHALLAQTGQAVSPGPLESVTLLGGDEEASAVMVDFARHTSGVTHLVMVARTATLFDPEKMLLNGQPVDLQGRWSEVGNQP